MEDEEAFGAPFAPLIVDILGEVPPKRSQGILPWDDQ